MDLPNLGSFSSGDATSTSSLDDYGKRVRKPYTITKSRESWTEPEHDKFLEALQLFDRDWKKIEAFIGSKTAIQIRSHAQKYFLKAQKNGTGEHLPPPRPKRKAARPPPQKASKVAQHVSLELPSVQSSPAVTEAGLIKTSDSSTTLRQPDDATFIHGWTDKSMPSTSCSQVARGDAKTAGLSLPNIFSSSSNGSMPRTRPTVLPDFAQVYSFIGSVFDPDVTGHLQKLKNMDRIDIETILLLMRNLSNNLASPHFEDHRRILSSYEFDPMDSAFIVTDSFPAAQSEAAA